MMLKKTISLGMQELKLADQGITLELEAFKAGGIDISIYLSALQQVYEQKQQFIKETTLFQHQTISYLSFIDKLWDGDKLAKSLL